MPYVTEKTDQCPASKPWGVFNKNTRDLRGRCHPSRARALAQMRALYAAENAKMNSEQAVLNFVKEFSDEWLDGNRKWVKIYPYSSWSHPVYTDTSIDEEAAVALKDSFDQKLYGEQDLVVSYDHGLDPAKGGKAAGWYEQLDVRNDGLWGLIRFTDTAREEIDAGEWRYFSGEHYDEWENPHTGEVNNLVFRGGALTNRPYVKEGMVPLNFSDIYAEKEFADWSTAYKNNLPDRAFLYIEPGGKKDSEGKTVPRSLRHFPVRDASGDLDLEHVRKVLQLAPKAKVPQSAKDRVIAAAKRMLGGKTMSEPAESDTTTDVTDEHAGQEHADPGQDQRLDERNDDDTDDGSRIDTPPGTPEDSVDENELRGLLGVSEDVTIKDAIEQLIAEVTPLREAAKAHSEAKSFAEMYPEQARELEDSRKERREIKAKQFAESFSHLTDTEGKPTGKGYPKVVLDKLEGLHKGFSEGTASITDIADVLDTISKVGLVDYDERGSSRNDETVLSDDPAKAFSEKVEEVKEADGLDGATAIKVAAEKFPELFEGYRKSLPGRR